MVKKEKLSSVKERNERTGAFALTLMTRDRNKPILSSNCVCHQRQSLTRSRDVCNTGAVARADWSRLPFTQQGEAALTSRGARK